FERRNFLIRSIAEVQRVEGLEEAEVYNIYAAKIFQTAMPQSSIRPRVMSFVAENGGIESDLYSIEYVPRSGRNKGLVYEQFYKGENFRLFAWLRDVAEERDGVLFKKEMRGTYWDYASETKNLTKEGGVEFKNGKKPLSMLRRILGMQPDKDMMVLDFFAGSSTTAHAVMQLNAEDEGNRRFIMVQLPEPVSEHSEALKAGVATVADISRKRIKLAGEKILATSPITTQSLDTGFRAYTLADTNFTKWRAESDVETNVLEQHLLDLRDSADDNATPESLLVELLLKQGYSLTEEVGDADISGLRLKSVGGGLVLAYLDEHAKPTLQQLREVLDSPDLVKFVILEDAFKGDDELKANLAQEAKSRNVELWTA
ncbi:DNA methyltransferase, partial [Rhodococcus sp. EPR-279]